MRNSRRVVQFLTGAVSAILWISAVNAECRSAEDVDCQARRSNQIYDTGGLPDPKSQDREEQSNAGSNSGSTERKSRSGDIPGNILDILKNMQ